MNMNEYAESSAWLKAENIENPIEATIRDVSLQQSNFGEQIVLEFDNFKYGMRKGHPNIKRLVETLGASSSDWENQKVIFTIEEYTDKDGNLKQAIVCKGVSVVVGKTPAQTKTPATPAAPPKPNFGDVDQELGF